MFGRCKDAMVEMMHFAKSRRVAVVSVRVREEIKGRNWTKCVSCTKRSYLDKLVLDSMKGKQLRDSVCFRFPLVSLVLYSLMGKNTSCMGGTLWKRSNSW